MRFRWIAATMALLVLAPDTSRTAQEQIQGSWVILDVEFDGVPIPDSPQRSRFVGSKLSFVGDTVINSQQSEVRARFTMDPSASPSTLDIITISGNEERRMLYTYQLDGDSLRLCFTSQSGSNRPPNVTSNNKQILLILKRQR